MARAGGETRKVVHRRSRRRLRAVLVPLVVLLVALAAVMSIRTWRMQPPPLGAAMHRPDLRVDMQQAAQRLSTAIRIATIGEQDPGPVDADPFVTLHVWLETAYPAFHAATTREVLDGGTLLFEWRGRDASLPPVILMAHQDVVPEVSSQQWTHPPFSGAITDTAIWGRGAIDNKGALIAMLEAAEALLTAGHQPQRTVLFVFGHDEETRGDGAAQAARLLAQRGVEALFVLDEGSVVVADHPVTGGAVALVGVSEKGYATVRLTVTAEGGHAAAPPPGTAVGILAQAIDAVMARPFARRYDGATRAMLEALAPHAPWPARLAIANSWLLAPLLVGQVGATPQGAAMLHTTVAPTMLSGSARENVLATEASATLNLRLAPGDTVPTVLRHLQAAIGELPVRLEVIGEARDPSALSPIDSEGFRTIARAAQAVFGVPVAPAPVIAATDSRSFAGLSQGIYRFQPVRLTLAETAMIHGVDEHLRLDALAQMIRFYGLLLAESTAGGATAASASTSPATMR